MRVVQRLPELNEGGVERGVVDLSRELVARGIESVVVSRGGRLAEAIEADGGRHLTLDVAGKNPLSAPARVLGLRALLRRVQPDLLHARSRVPAWLAFLANRSLRLPCQQRRPPTSGAARPRPRRRRSKPAQQQTPVVSRPPRPTQLDRSRSVRRPGGLAGLPLKSPNDRNSTSARAGRRRRGPGMARTLASAASTGSRASQHTAGGGTGGERGPHAPSQHPWSHPSCPCCAGHHISAIPSLQAAVLPNLAVWFEAAVVAPDGTAPQAVRHGPLPARGPPLIG